MLSEHEQEEDAKQVLKELLAHKGIDAETYNNAVDLLTDLSEDTSEV